MVPGRSGSSTLSVAARAACQPERHSPRHGARQSPCNNDQDLSAEYPLRLLSCNFWTGSREGPWRSPSAKKRPKRPRRPRCVLVVRRFVKDGRVHEQRSTRMVDGLGSPVEACPAAVRVLARPLTIPALARHGAPSCAQLLWPVGLSGGHRCEPLPSAAPGRSGQRPGGCAAPPRWRFGISPVSAARRFRWPPAPGAWRPPLRRHQPTRSRRANPSWTCPRMNARSASTARHRGISAAARAASAICSARFTAAALATSRPSPIRKVRP